MFKKLSDIRIDEEESWINHTFLTLDIDWASDEVIAYAIDVLEKYDVAATWFITHDSPILNRLRANSKFELGIHPNFNQCLFEGNSKSVYNYLDDLKQVVPEAISLRSHSLTKNSMLSNCLLERGFTHESNIFINNSDIELKPFELPKGLTQVCYNWGDYSFFSSDGPQVIDYMKTSGLRVLNFHPIHIYLNTCCIDQYNSAKTVKNIKTLKEHVNIDSYGIKNYLEQFIKCSSITRIDNISVESKKV